MTVHDAEAAEPAQVRQITLDPLMEREPLTIQPVRPESTIGCGFRMAWFTGEGSGEQAHITEFSIDTGAGLGTSYLTLSVTLDDGSHIEEYIDMRPVVEAWIKAAVEAGPTP